MMKINTVFLLCMCLVFGEAVVRRQRDIEALRLVGGPNEHSGRLEVMVENVWGTICSQSSQRLDHNVLAQVACRSMGYPGNSGFAMRYGSALIGQPDPATSMLLDDIRCRGNETSINDCHKYHAGGNTECRDPEEFISIGCGFTRIDDVRIVALPNDTFEDHGLVEVMSRGVWGTVCDHGFTNNAARVICRSLGFANGTGFLTRRRSSANYTAQILLDNVRCQGHESSLNECQHSAIGHTNCQHHNDVTIACGTLSVDRIRLVNDIGSARPNSGRVEVFMHGSWGAICGQGLLHRDAEVICRTLGLPAERARARGYAHFGYGTLPVLLDRIECIGNETHLNDCELSAWVNCHRSRNGGVDCV